MDAAAIGQVISAALSGAFGAGAASWIIKQLITRSFKKIDKLEAEIAQIVNIANGISTQIALIEQRIEGLTSFKKESRDLERNVIDLTHKISVLEKTDKESLGAIKELRDYIMRIEKDVERNKAMVASKN